MSIAIQICLIVVGLIHLLPVMGVLGGAQLQRLYGLPLSDPSLLVLLQHRALLFGLLGVFLIAAAWRTELRPWAYVGGGISAGAFILIASLHPTHNASIQRVVLADWVAVALLGIAVALEALARRP